MSEAPKVSSESIVSRLQLEREDDRCTLQLKNPHSRDKSILFDEEPHKYYINGTTEGWVSVTTVISEFFEKFDSLGQATRIAQREDFLTNRSYRKYHDICDDYEAHGRPRTEAILAQWEAIRDEAASLGTNLHLCIELFYNGIDPEKDEETKGKVPAEYYEQFITYQLLQDKHFEPFRTEMIVWDNQMHVCGSVDMLYRHRGDGSYHLRDWKRSKKIQMWSFGGKRATAPLGHLKDTNYSKYCLQLNLYSELLRRNYGISVQSMAIVVFHPNQKGKYLEFEVSPMPKEMELLVDHHIRRTRATAEGNARVS
jgi:hypothetical protein